MQSGEIMTKHLDTERLLLINSFLDIGYIGTGFLLRHLSDKSATRSDLLKGYGNSLLLQGGFLMIFDMVLYGTMINHPLDFIHRLNLVSTPQMTALQINIPIL
jgi:hypothetical protein